MKTRQKGFSAVEAIIVVAVVALVAFGGWFVWQKQHKNTETPTNTNNSQQATDQKYYDDGNVAFTYPATWSVTPHTNNPTGVVEVEAPVDPSIRLIGEDRQPTQYQNMKLTITIVPKPSIEGSRDCADGCKVFEVQPINNPNLKDAKLVIADGNGGTGYPLNFTVVDDPAVKKDASDYRRGITANNAVRAISADVMFDKRDARNSFGWIANLDDFKKTASYTDMLKIIDTVAFR